MPVVCVSGYHGAGKTVLCNRLSQRLGWPRSYAGAIFRAFAEESGMEIERFYAEMANCPEVEREIDRRQEKFMNESDGRIVEGRMAPFLPSVFPKVNVLLTVDEKEGARRRLKELRERGEAKKTTLNGIVAKNRERLAVERARYKALCGIEDHLAPRHFTVVIDTTALPEMNVFRAILAIVERRI